MSENPPRILPENVRDLELPPAPKVIQHTLEESRVLSAEEGGGKVNIEKVVECDGSAHIEFREEMTYDATGALVSTIELDRKRVGSCDGAHN